MKGKVRGVVGVVMIDTMLTLRVIDDVMLVLTPSTIVRVMTQVTN